MGKGAGGCSTNPVSFLRPALEALADGNDNLPKGSLTVLAFRAVVKEMGKGASGCSTNPVSFLSPVLEALADGNDNLPDESLTVLAFRAVVTVTGKGAGGCPTNPVSFLRPALEALADGNDNLPDESLTVLAFRAVVKEMGKGASRCPTNPVSFLRTVLEALADGNDILPEESFTMLAFWAVATVALGGGKDSLVVETLAAGFGVLEMCSPSVLLASIGLDTGVAAFFPALAPDVLAAASRNWQPAGTERGTLVCACFIVLVTSSVVFSALFSTAILTEAPELLCSCSSGFSSWTPFSMSL
jgi:hypothetical protein